MEEHELYEKALRLYESRNWSRRSRAGRGDWSQSAPICVLEAIAIAAGKDTWTELKASDIPTAIEVARSTYTGPRACIQDEQALSWVYALNDQQIASRAGARHFLRACMDLAAQRAYDDSKADAENVTGWDGTGREVQDFLSRNREDNL